MPIALKADTLDFMIPIDSALSTTIDRFGPNVGPPIAARITSEYRAPFVEFHTRREQITRGGTRTLSAFEREELMTAYRKVKAKLDTNDREILKPLKTQQQTRVDAATRQEPPQNLESREIYHLRLENHGERLRELPPEELVTRIRAGKWMRDIEAIRHFDSIGFPIPHPQQREIISQAIAEATLREAEARDPQIAELTAIHQAYESAHHMVANQMRAWAERDGIDVWDISDAHFSNGEPATVEVRK